MSFGLQIFPEVGSAEPGRQIIEAGLLAERLGFDAFFIGDHPGYQPEAWLHLAALSARTSRIGLGSVVNCALHRHPAMLARQAADLDHLSGGRLILGLGIGWNAAEFAQLGLPFPSVPDRQQALAEAIEILIGVWGPEPFTFEGRHWSTRGGHVVPSPLQRPRPPILIAGSGERTTLRQVAQYADICNFGSGRNVGGVVSRADFARKFTVLRAHCDRLGRPYDDIVRSHFTTWLMLSETDAGAKAKRDRYYPDGLNDDQRLTRIYGTPGQAVAYFQDLADAGLQYFVVQVLDAADHETFRLLAEEVMPHVHPRN